MTRSRIRGTFACLTAALVFGLALLALGPSPRRESTQAADPPRKPRPAGKPVPLPANLVGLEMALGLKDQEPAQWDGDIQVSEGRILGLDVLRGGPQAKAEGNRFTTRSRRMMVQQRPVVVGPEFRM